MDQEHQETQKDKQCDSCDEGSAVPHGKDENYQKPDQAKHAGNGGERITDTFVPDGHQNGGDNKNGE